MDDKIAQRLADMRREHGYSQEALASELGLSCQAISKWERGESQPDTTNLIALADLYDVTLDELVRPHIAESKQDDAGAVEEPESASSAIDETKMVDQARNVDGPSFDANRIGQANAVEACCNVTPESSSSQQDAQAAASEHTQYAPPQVPPVYPAPKRHDPLKTFPYPVLVAIIYLFTGLVFGIWHPTWIIFLTIPFYYWMVKVISDDRKHQQGRFDGTTPYTQG